MRNKKICNYGDFEISNGNTEFLAPSKKAYDAFDYNKSPFSMAVNFHMNLRYLNQK